MKFQNDQWHIDEPTHACANISNTSVEDHTGISGKIMAITDRNTNLNKSIHDQYKRGHKELTEQLDNYAKEKAELIQLKDQQDRKILELTGELHRIKEREAQLQNITLEQFLETNQLMEPSVNLIVPSQPSTISSIPLKNSVRMAIDYNFDQFFSTTSGSSALEFQAKKCILAHGIDPASMKCRESKWHTWGPTKIMPGQMFFTSFRGCVENYIHEAFPLCRTWGYNVTSAEISELFNPLEVVFINSQSETVLQIVNTDKVYAIPGIVRKPQDQENLNKLIRERGFMTARLPVQENFSKKGGKSAKIINLAYNAPNLFHILNSFAENGCCWKKTIGNLLVPMISNKINEKKRRLSAGVDPYTLLPYPTKAG